MTDAEVAMRRLAAKWGGTARFTLGSERDGFLPGRYVAGLGEARHRIDGNHEIRVEEPHWICSCTDPAEDCAACRRLGWPALP